MGFDVLDVDAPRLNRWSNITVVFRGAVGDVKMYIKGRQVGTAPLTYNPVPSTVNLRIGLTEAPDFKPAFAGDIDDIRIYERALTAREVKALASEQPAHRTREKRVA
jgi:hypothetical protein